MKREKYVKVEGKNDGTVTLHFSPMYSVKATRRELPPPTKVEKAKKGKGSYSRKGKHKNRCYDVGNNTCFYFM